MLRFDLEQGTARKLEAAHTATSAMSLPARKSRHKPEGAVIAPLPALERGLIAGAGAKTAAGHGP